MIALVALWVELRPDPLVDHPFATVAIEPGDPIGDWNVETRRVPAGLLSPVQSEGVAIRSIEEGDPLVASSVGENESLVPSGWWTIEIDLASGAARGDRAQVVLLDSETIASAVVVAAASDDPLNSGRGAVAVEAEYAAEVAAAAAEGRIAVMIESG